MDGLVASPLLERVLDEERRHHRIQEGLNLQLVKMHHGASPHTAVSPSRDSRRTVRGASSSPPRLSAAAAAALDLSGKWELAPYGRHCHISCTPNAPVALVCVKPSRTIIGKLVPIFRAASLPRPNGDAVQCTVLTPPPSCPGLLSLIASPANGSHVIIVEQHRDGAEPLVLTRIEEAIPDAPRRAGRHHGHGDAPSPNHVRQQRMRLAIRLAEYFRTNDPARLGEVDALLHKYQGHERQLLRDIRAQYGVPLSGPSEKNYVRRNGLGRVLVMPQSDTLEQRVKARTRDASTAKSAPRKAWHAGAHQRHRDAKKTRKPAVPRAPRAPRAASAHRRAVAETIEAHRDSFRSSQNRESTLLRERTALIQSIDAGDRPRDQPALMRGSGGGGARGRTTQTATTVAIRAPSVLARGVSELQMNRPRLLLSVSELELLPCAVPTLPPGAVAEESAPHVCVAMDCWSSAESVWIEVDRTELVPWETMRSGGASFVRALVFDSGEWDESTGCFVVPPQRLKVIGTPAPSAWPHEVILGFNNLYDDDVVTGYAKWQEMGRRPCTKVPLSLRGPNSELELTGHLTRRAQLWWGGADGPSQYSSSYCLPSSTSPLVPRVWATASLRASPYAHSSAVAVLDMVRRRAADSVKRLKAATLHELREIERIAELAERVVDGRTATPVRTALIHHAKLCASYHDFLLELRKPACANESRPKRASAKNDPSQLRFVATGLHVFKFGVAREVNVAAGDAPAAANASYVTVVGCAPAAHALGFDAGGLRRLELQYAADDVPMYTIDGSIDEAHEQRRQRQSVDIAVRRDVVLSQAVAMLVTTFVEEALAHCRASDAMWWRQIASCGFLLGFEVLLGSRRSSGEGGMAGGVLEDTASAVRLLRDVTIRLVRELPVRGGPGSLPESTSGVHVWRIEPGAANNGAPSSTVIDICLADRVNEGWSWRWLPKKLRDGARIGVVPTLFAQEVQPPTVGASSSPDALAGLHRNVQEINDECLFMLRGYYDRVASRNGHDASYSAGAGAAGTSNARSFTFKPAVTRFPTPASERSQYPATARASKFDGSSSNSRASKLASSTSVETHGAWLDYTRVDGLFDDVDAVVDDIAAMQSAGGGRNIAVELDQCLIVQQLTRAMRGGRVCCGCGSGETVALVASLEAALMLSKSHGLPGAAFHDTLRAMRMAGVWRQLNRANLGEDGIVAARDALRLTAHRGTRKADAANPLATSYAFDLAQFETLPELLCPPRGAARCFLESVALPGM
tara:strand:- start:87 stop:3860 length:3774 start_codon:yes stop_codon:yes gene_type:complete